MGRALCALLLGEHLPRRKTPTLHSQTLVYVGGGFWCAVWVYRRGRRVWGSQRRIWACYSQNALLYDTVVVVAVSYGQVVTAEAGPLSIPEPQ